MKFYFATLFSIILFYSCTNNSSTPCDFEITEIRAQIIAIDPYMKEGKELFHVKMNVVGSGLSAQPQYLEQLKDIEIDSAFVARNKLKVKNTYLGTVSELKSGDCQPRYISFNHKLE